MRAFRRRRRLVIIAAASLALHVVVLVWLAWPTAPTLLAIGPDLSSMSVELLRPERPTPSPARSGAIRKSPLADVAAPAPVATPRADQVPPVVSAPAGAAPTPAVGAVAPDALRAALRAGAGCSGLASASREEREACEEKLGRLRAGAPSYAAPMDPGKRAYYDAVAAAGPTGGGYGDPKPGAATPDADYFRVLNCSIKFGAGRKSKDRQGEVRLGRTPCSIPVQGSFIAPEASVRKR
ncbi:hypothetical protein [Caulobacter sp. RL271]|uniref:Uncharacterized protein n=1 Tax=Caulobacter segnis TaxID=88688 RepID=A0ABY4ZT38_9CAUL|nr:hypothetical protein [Caulobacter segnis]USQ95665.1 hypothetical protein MZV50_24500 [Caulobacter segnis]